MQSVRFSFETIREALDHRATTPTGQSNLVALMASSAALALAAATGGVAWAGPALPTGGKVAAGQASLSQAGSTLTVSQSTSKSIIDWSSFSIGQGQTVQFNNGSGATLNRVLTGGPSSQIDGTLSATGSVYLINSSGVIVGKSGVVNVGGSFVASTLDISNTAFLAGGDLTFSGSSQAAVINYGKIGALGGDIVLQASTVANAGTLIAPNGEAGLLAGTQVLLRDQADLGGKFAVQIGGAGTSVTNSGDIAAVAAELRAENGNVYALAGNTQGLIRATEVSGQGGQIQLTSVGGSVNVAAGAMLDASADQAASGTGAGGHVYVDSANTTIAGAVLAKGGPAGGAGGLVETSGATLNIDGAKIDAGVDGQWLLDPTTLTIDTAAATSLDASLAAGTSVAETATSSLTVAAPIAWSTSAGLTLSSGGTLAINAPITVSGAGQLTLAYSTTSATNLSFGLGPTGFVGSVDYTGAGGALTINGAAYTLVQSLSAIGATGNYALAQPLTSSTAYTTAPVNEFSGTFEGLGNTITGLTINGTGTSVGLFGTQTSGTIRDIGLVGGSVSGGGDVGALVGFQNSGSITQAYATGAVSASSVYVGGLVGFQNSGSITQAYATGAVSASSGYVGGLVGFQESGSITQAYATGAVSGSGDAVGGLVGLQESGSITQAYATGAVSGSGNAVGGLVGVQYGAIADAYATGAVKGGAEVGGLVGYQDGAIADAYATGAVKGGSGVGGLVGYQYSSTSITQAYATGAVSGSSDVGGLVGYQDGAIADAYATGAVSGTPYAGGLVGFTDTGSSISGSYYDSSTTGQQSGVGPSPRGSGTATPLTTANFQTTSAATNLGSAFAGGPGLYPYLTALFPTGVQAVSGIAYSNAVGTTLAASGANGAVPVTISLNGTAVGTATTGANGYYYFALPAGSSGTVVAATAANSATGAATASATASVTANTNLTLRITPAVATTVAGTVYSDYGQTPATTGTVDEVLLNAGSTLVSSGAIGTGGAYSLAAPASNGAILLFVSGGGNLYANTIARYAGKSLTGINLYGGYLTFVSPAATTLSSTLSPLAGFTAPAGYSADMLFNTTTGAPTAGLALTGLSGAFSFDTALNLGANTLIVSDTGAVAQSAAITAGGVLLQGAGGSYTLTNGGNSIATLAANTGAVTVASSAASLTVGTVAGVSGVTSSGAVSLAAAPTGALTLASGVTAGAGANVTLSAGGVFTNTAGASAVTTSGGGVWDIYSANPTNDAFGGLASGNTAVWNTAPGAAIAQTGDRYVFAYQPTLTITTTNDAKTYGQTSTTNGLATDYTITGLYAGNGSGTAFTADTAANVYSGAPTIGSAGAAQTADVGGGTGANGAYAITASATGLTVGAGYAVSLANSGLLTVNPEAITVTATDGSKVYDGGVASSLTPTVTGGTLYAGDATLSQTYNSKDVATATTLTPAELFATGKSVDYTVTNVAAAGTITPYTLTAGLTGSVSKTYDSTTAATLGASNYTLTSAIAGDAVSLNGPTSGTYASSNAGTGLGVSVSGLTLANNTAGDYQLAATTLSANIGTITAEAITVTAAGGSKVYDGGLASSLTPTVTSGTLYAGDATLSQTYNSKDVVTATTLTPSEAFAAGKSVDYTVTNVAAAGTITPYTLTASLTGSVSKTYDSTTAATLGASNYTLTSAIAGDAVSLNGPTSGTYANPNAGTGLGVSVSGLTLANNTAGDYQLAATTLSANIGTITAEAITVTAAGGSKVYDGGVASSLTPTVTSGTLYAGDATLSQTYNSKDVATATTLTPVETFASTTTASDYTVKTVTAVGTITPASITASLIGTVAKTYDSNDVAPVTPGNITLSGVYAGDTVAATQPSAGEYASVNVGTGIQVGATGFSLSGAQASDYKLSNAYAFGNVGTITPEAITVTAVGGSKVYNDSTASSLTPTVTSGILYGTDAALSETYNAKDVATATTLTPVETFASTTTANDYIVKTVTASGSITPASVTASLIGTVAKTYDSNDVAPVTPGNITLAGVYAGDTVATTQPSAGEYASVNVGTGIQVGATGFSLSGAQAGDYKLSNAYAFGNVGTITPAALAVSLTGTTTKVYNGNANATLTPANYVLSGFVSGQGASVSQAAGTYTDDNVATGIGVTSLLSLSSLAPKSGTLLSNYTLPTSASGNIGTITPATLSVSLTGTVSKVYDASITATLTPGNYNLSGVIGSDQVFVATTTGTYATKNVASAIPVTVSDLTLGGAAGQDYKLNVASLTSPIGAISPQIISTTPSTLLSGAATWAADTWSAPGDFGLSETIGSTTTLLVAPPVLPYNPLLTPVE